MNSQDQQRRHRILVIEDNQDNIVLITDVLRSLNYEVIQATDGEKGLEKAAMEHPHLILMDLSLPRVDGWTVTRQLKADPDLRHIPVIALTAHAMMGDRERALQAGCDDYLSKPINMQELVKKLTRFLT